MQQLVNFITAPGVTALLGVVLGIVLKGLFDVLGENRRLAHASQERRDQWEREDKDRENQRAHEERLRQIEARDRRMGAYARFLGMAHTVKHRGEEVTGEDLRALAESYGEADIVTRSEAVRSEAYWIFQEALGGSTIDTDAFIAAMQAEESRDEEDIADSSDKEDQAESKDKDDA